MRPKTIVLFERFYLLAILIEMVRIAAQGRLLAQSSLADMSIRIAAVGISLLLVLLTSRRRKWIAGVLLAALFMIGLPVVSTLFQPGVDVPAAAFIFLQIILQIAAIALLVAPASRAWFADRTPAGN